MNPTHGQPEMKGQLLLVIPILILSGCSNIVEGRGPDPFAPIIGLAVAADSVLPSHTPVNYFQDAELSIPPVPEKPTETSVRPPKPGVGFVWVDGAYIWGDHLVEGARTLKRGYKWQPGEWVQPPKGTHTFTPGHWVAKKNEYNSRLGVLKDSYVYCEGRWE